MVIASWNVQGREAVVLDYLRSFNVDVAVLQEACLTTSGAHAEREFCGRADGGSLHVVILEKYVSIVPRAPLSGGTVLPVYFPKWNLHVLNVHAIRNTEMGESHDYQGFRRCVDGILEFCYAHGGPVLVAGDLNASVLFKYDVSRFAKEFKRLASAGFHDLACDTECASTFVGECKTMHGPTRGKKYRVDYFLSNVKQLGMTTVGSSGKLSDHDPIMLELPSKMR